MQNTSKKLSEHQLNRFKLAIKNMMITNDWQSAIEPVVRALEKRYDKLNTVYKTKTASTGHNFAIDNGTNILANSIIKISNDLTFTITALEKFMNDFYQFDNDVMELISQLDSDKNPEKATAQLEQFEQMCEAIHQKHLTVNELMEQTNLAIQKAETTLQLNAN